MSLTAAPRPAGICSYVPCIICTNTVPLLEVTPGSLYADGTQAFACSIHLRERTPWIKAWAAFDAEQQLQRVTDAITEAGT